ncbi:MAG TPA: nicotinamidase [Burkholderiales bacterium]|nr:nicotinamidase [Burkholderiales bacterium]
MQNRPIAESTLAGARGDKNAVLVPAPGDALLIVDVQNDFLPGGSLAVPKGDEIIPVLNRQIARFAKLGLPVIATRDWHPPDHCSFHQAQGPWPSHCVANSAGAQFAPALRLPTEVRVISKATYPDRDAYSGFSGTDLDQFLRSRGIRRLFVGGLATDYCVLNTVKDALALGYQVVLLRDAIRAVDVNPGDGACAEEEMRRLGAIPAYAQGASA